MGQKLYFGFVLLFFVLMNALLWRSLLGHQNAALSLPVASVLRRLLESADDSILEIRHRSVKIGNCHWSASIQTSQAPPTEPNLPMLEGMVPSISSYHIEFDGTVTTDPLNALRCKFSLLLDTNQVWQEMDFTLAWRPTPMSLKTPGSPAWDLNVRSDAAKKVLAIAFSQGQERQAQTYSLDDPKHPEKLFSALSTGLFAERFQALGLPLGAILSPSSLPNLASTGVSWKARASHCKIGHSFVPVYQLEASLLDSPLLILSILESGEILKVELPGDWDLVNAELLSM